MYQDATQTLDAHYLYSGLWLRAPTCLGQWRLALRSHFQEYVRCRKQVLEACPLPLCQLAELCERMVAETCLRLLEVNMLLCWGRTGSGYPMEHTDKSFGSMAVVSFVARLFGDVAVACFLAIAVALLFHDSGRFAVSTKW